MDTDDLCYRSAREQAALVAKGRVSATELLDAHLDRISRVDGSIHAVVTVDAERARQTARAYDQGGAPSGSPVLGGVPFTVKDSFMVAGVRTTSGAPELADYVPDHDAVSVAGLRDAGAVPFAKTNLPIYAGDVQSFNQLFGTTNNPWNAERSCGGSSGGSAAAVAAGFSSIEIGSDIAGSIRNPSMCCGVVGHKPSYGIVSGRGQIPGPPGTLTQADLAVVGPIARTVDDCRLGLDLMAGADEWMAPAWSLQLPPARSETPKGLRVAVWADDPYCPVDPEVSAAIEAVAAGLESAGARVDNQARPRGFDFAKADRVFLELLGSALAGGWSRSEIEEMADQVKAGLVPAGGLGIEGATLRHRDWLSANERRLQIRARWREFFGRWDVVLAPVSPTVAIAHDHSFPMTARTIDVAGEQRPYGAQMQWVGLFGMAWLPATAVPIGVHSSGLPMGLQVVGPYLEDYTALAAAAMIESLDGCGFQRPPGL